MNEESTAALYLLSRMRFACGDNGLRMQDELEEYLRDLRRDAERYRWLRSLPCGEDFGSVILPDEQMSSGYGGFVSGAELDAAIDAAMNGANTRVNASREAASR